MDFRLLRMPLRPAARLYRRTRALSALRALRSHSNSKVRLIEQALRDAVTDRIPAPEADRFASIEQRRVSLVGSDNEINVMDYGAGDGQTDRTLEEMQNGVQFTTTVGKVSKASKSPFWAKVLFQMVRKLRPTSCVELGTCVGISSSYQAVALEFNGQGQIVTLEGSPEVADVARDTTENLKLPGVRVVTGPFHDTLVEVLESSRPIDFFFNDGHHDENAVMRYFYQALPNLSSDAVAVIDDISWSPGMRRAWNAVEEHERVVASIDLEQVGIAVLGETGKQNGSEKRKHTIPLKTLKFR